MDDEIFETWIPEPCSIDETYLERGEHTLDWLARSTIPRARECRRFLNERISKMPEQHQMKMLHDLKERWHSAFFELITASILHELGASLVFENANLSGSRPDFLATFPDGTVVIEAKAPVINGTAEKAAEFQQPLLKIIESLLPRGWMVAVCDLPEIGPSDSKAEFKSRVRQLLNVPPPRPEDTETELVDEFAQGTLHLHLFPTGKTTNALAWRRR